MPIHSRRGLTLVELLVVLAILAIMTTVAVVSTDQLVDQGRYNATQRTLQNIQDAIIGPANQRAADGSLLITGFVADMGRLPQPVDLTTDPLRELWDPTAIPPTSLASAYGGGLQTVNVPTSTASAPTLLVVAPSTSTTANPYNPTLAPVTLSVSIPCGWRGPYLQLPVGNGGRLLDGWGNPFDMLQIISPFPTARNSPVNVTAPIPPILAVRSLGADNAVDPSPFPTNFAAYNPDLYVPSQPGTPPPTSLVGFPYQGGVPVQVLAMSNAAGSPVSVTAATWAGGMATITTSSPLALAAGSTFMITNVAAGFNGTFTFTMTSSVSGNTLTFAMPTSPTGTYTGSGGTITVLQAPTLTAPVAIGSNDAVTIVLFVPVNGVLNAVAAVNPTTSFPYFRVPLDGPAAFTFTNAPTGSVGLGLGSSGLVTTFTNTIVPIGPRFIQAFQFDTTSGATNGWIRKRSPLLPLMVPAGGVPPQTLILPLNPEANF